MLRVALAGASGTLGTPMLHALLDAGLDVTVLTRHASAATFPPAAKVTRVDYENLEEFTSALKGQDVLISTITTFSIPAQKLMIDAAVAAGVRRFFPSEFGSDASNPTIGGMPMYGMKSDVDRYLRSRCSEPGCRMTWTAVYCSCFLDWGIDHKFYLDLEGKTCTLYDGGDFPVATSPTDWVGGAVASILRDRFEETANREVRVSGVDVSQRELLSIAQSVAGAEGWTVTEVASDEVYEKAMEVYKNDPKDVWGWVFGMLVKSVFGEGCTRDFDAKCDNGWLGLNQISREQVESYVRRAAETGKAGKTF